MMTNERNLLRVLGEENLARDPETGAVLNTSDQARMEHIKRVNRQRRVADRVDSVAGQVLGLKTDIEEISSRVDSVSGRIQRLEEGMNEISATLGALVKTLTEAKRQW